MAVKILEVKKKDIPLDWLGVEEQSQTPDTIFRVSIEQVKNQKQPYDVPKKYPDDIKQLVEKAKKRTQQKKKAGFTKEQFFDEFSQIQRKIAENINNKK